MSEKIIIGNWKMHKTHVEAKAFIEALAPKLETKAYLAVPYTALVSACNAAKDTLVEIGAQNLSEHEGGAYTGEVSGDMIRASGAGFVLVGHSERRHVYGESDEVICAKVERALKSGLTPVLCIGETEQEREAQATAKVLQRQLELGLKGLSSDVLAPLIVAYEPVWAIGTGRSATPEMAQEAHSCVRRFLADMHGRDFSERPILYGGSVKPSNAKELLSMDDIDGALIGGASLEVENFLNICKV